jgi:hypothetical protein
MAPRPTPNINDSARLPTADRHLPAVSGDYALDASSTFVGKWQRA